MHTHIHAQTWVYTQMHMHTHMHADITTGSLSLSFPSAFSSSSFCLTYLTPLTVLFPLRPILDSPDQSSKFCNELTYHMGQTQRHSPVIPALGK